MGRRLLSVLVVCGALVVAPGCENLKIRMSMVKGNKAYKAQKYDEAIVEYKNILAMDPEHFMANYLVAISNLAQYHPGSTHPRDVQYANESIAAFEKTLKLTPPGTADEQKGWREKLQKYYLSLLVSAQQEDKAIAYLEEQRLREPNNVVIIQQLATHYARRDFDKALAAFEKVAELEPTKEHWYTVGVVCWERSYKGAEMVSNEDRTQLVDKGLAALNKALAIDPQYFEALSYVNLLNRELAKVYAAQQNLEGYTKALQTADEYMKKALEARKRKQATEAAKS
jgi:tetratricopeptide (TPR) repeat protein